MNRAFVYGDLLFESIKVSGGMPQFLTLHYNRLMQSAQILKFETDLSIETFEQIVNDTITQSSLKEARVRFVMHRNAEGFYTPSNNQTLIFTEIFPLVFASNNILTLGVYTDNYKPCTELSSIKSGNALLCVMAGIFANENGFDDSLILNEHGCVCEATSSNIFMVKNEKVYTPALTEGCVAGVMRHHILEQLRNADYEVQETMVTLEQLLDADAIFLTNAIRGVMHVGFIGNKEFKISAIHA
jgi:branched-chain amino acid aminotransferase